MASQKKVLRITFCLGLLALLTSGCTSKPSWQIIAENLKGYVVCEDVDLDSEGNPSYGYGPCVKLTNVTYDQAMGDAYCFNTTPMIGGYSGESYSSIEDWRLIADQYYCVTWSGRYVDSDPNEPSDWRVTFSGAQPYDLLP
jgi:hypothetical protein